MSKLYFKKTINGLVPSDSNTKMVLGKVEMRKIVRVTLNVARNYEFHKKVMALVKVGFDNQDIFSDMDLFRKWLTVKCGPKYCDVITIDGVINYFPKSWAFNGWDNLEFSEFYKVLWGVIYNDVLDGVEKMELEASALAEVREFMND